MMLHPTTCPHCGSMHARPHDEVPTVPGDVTLCFSCGEWCVFDDKLELVMPGGDVLDAITASAECFMLRTSWLAFNAGRKVEKV